MDHQCKIDELGRVLLPKKLRETLNWGKGVTLLLCQDGDEVVVQLLAKSTTKKAESVCCVP